MTGADRRRMQEPADAAAAATRAAQPAVLITGAGGEVGHGLMDALKDDAATALVGLDIRELPEEYAAMCAETLRGDICDATLLQPLHERYRITHIYHLAALLSSRAERDPEQAHRINVDGSMTLFRFAVEQARRYGEPVTFVYPSSIAVYGLPDLATKERAGAVGEPQFLDPVTMYGCNKLYVEHLGRYFSRHYRQIEMPPPPPPVDFRCVRYPGLISAHTVPSGGTSDYAPEMLHAAAQGEPYACFVREDARIPFMTMPDAIEATLTLAHAPRESLRHCVYNLGAFAPRAEGFAELVREFFPQARITFEPHPKRQAMVDSWPADVDTTAARTEWGFAPKHDLHTAFAEYLVPAVKRRYGVA